MIDLYVPSGNSLSMLRLIFSTLLAVVAHAASQTCLGECQQTALAFAYQVRNKNFRVYEGIVLEIVDSRILNLPSEELLPCPSWCFA